MNGPWSYMDGAAGFARYGVKARTDGAGTPRGPAVGHLRNKGYGKRLFLPKAARRTPVVWLGLWLGQDVRWPRGRVHGRVIHPPNPANR